jgi:MerR family copper efflux transcriptional regulator
LKVYRRYVDGYRISQLAERVGVPATTLRFYESAGLLPAGRTASGYRIYNEEAVERLGFIGAAKRLGLSLEEIAELLEVWERGPCADVRDEMRQHLVARIADAERRAAELAAFTAAVQQAIEHLDTLPDRSERCGIECCPTGAVQSDHRPGLEHVGDARKRGGDEMEHVGDERRSGGDEQGRWGDATKRGDGEMEHVGVRELAGDETERLGDSRGCEQVGDVRECGGGDRPAAHERWRTAPVACSLSSSDERDERAARWAVLLVGASKTQIGDGVRLTLPSDRAARIAELTAAEQACCPFFGFRLEFDGPAVHLEVRAPSDGMDLLNALFS